MSMGIIAGVVGAGASIYAASKAGDAAEAGAAAASKTARNELAFQREQYDDWKEIYGPLQEDVGTYYKNLTGEELVGKELEEIQAAGQAANVQIEQTLAQRGMDSSGLYAGMANQNTYNTEMQKALQRSTADQRAAQEKQKFLALGLGQGQGIMGAMSGSSANIANAQMAGGNAKAASYTAMGNAASSAIGYAGTMYANQAASSVPASAYANVPTLDLF